MNIIQRQKKWNSAHRRRIWKGILAALGLLTVLGSAGCGRLHEGSGDRVTSERSADGNATEKNVEDTEKVIESMEIFTESAESVTESAAEASTETSSQSATEQSTSVETAEPTSASGETVPESSAPETEPETSEADIVAGQVEALLADMTLEEKIYQMFIITPEQLTGVPRVTAAGDTTRMSLEQYPVGGLVYFSGNLVSIDQTKAMLSNIQRFSNEIEGVDLFLCVDEEGGQVARVAGNEAFQIENIPPMANVFSEEEAYRCGDTIGAYLSELGFNVDFAPDADVLTNSANIGIGDRSFGSDPDAVTKYAAAYSDGLHANGMMSTFKHFPGHGATAADTHEGYAYTDKSYEELMEAELKPFLAAEENGVDMVMVGHISVPTVTGDNVPSSLSEQMVTGILRGEFGYDGLIVTDALNMTAIVAYYGSSAAAVKAVTAGVDLLLMPGDFQAAYSGIYDAVRNGEISEERIDESVRRILTVKVKMSQNSDGM